jgi:hypothetical protein
VLRVWWRWTLALASGVLGVGLVYGFGLPLRIAALVAVLLDLRIAASCFRAWSAIAEYRWFWWRR